TITIQNYFRMYTKLAGMTGTAATEAEELFKVYKLEVTQIPTNKPMVRKDNPDLVYKTEQGKWDAVVAEVKERNEAGQPVLIGTERHEARRIDNQLRGRSGRQGDPGSSRFFSSLEDDLIRIFASERVAGLMARLGFDDSTPIESGMVTGAITQAQVKVEGRNFDIRKRALEFDDVLNNQRNVIYGQRRLILEKGDVRETVLDYLHEAAADLVDANISSSDPEDWDTATLAAALDPLLGRNGEITAAT